MAKTELRRFAIALVLTTASVVTPAAAEPVPPALPSQTYYLEIDGSPEGPFTIPQLRSQVVEGRMTPESLIWQPGFTEWTRAGFVDAVASAFGTQIESSDTVGAYLVGRWHTDSTVFIELESRTIHHKADFTRTYRGDGTFVSAGTTLSVEPDWRGEFTENHSTIVGTWLVLATEGEKFNVRTFETTHFRIAGTDHEDVARTDTLFVVDIIDENTFHDGYMTWQRIQ